MSKDKLTDYDSSTASNNTDVGGISVAEGMLPSAVNNSLRELTKQLGAFADGTDGIDVLSLADDDASHAIKLQAPSAVTADTTFTLPDGDGTADQVLKTDGSGQLGFADRHSNPSLIINGAMQVAARGTSETGVTTTGVFVLDRFVINVADTAEYTISQSTTTPDGFANSMKWDNTTANASPSSGQYALFSQKIEGQNLQHLKYGTASAQSVTLSFWVRSNKTGTYIAELLQPDASNRHINKAYTISSADTWEHKTITFSGDTSGVINNDNGSGLSVTWWLGAGSDYSSGTLQTSWGALDQTARAVGNVNLSDSTSNEWYITGVKLEVGSTATPFEHRSYADELIRCQRYYQRLASDGAYDALMDGMHLVTTQFFAMHSFPTTMRTEPTMSGGGTFSVLSNGSDKTPDSLIVNRATIDVMQTYSAMSGGNVGVAGHAGQIRNNNDATTFLEFKAEL